MPQARKKTRNPEPVSSQIAHRLSESFFILSILLAVYLVACLGSYDPTDPGPFNSTASDQVHNMGRLLGAWLANFFPVPHRLPRLQPACTADLHRMAGLRQGRTAVPTKPLASNGWRASPACCCSFFPRPAWRTYTPIPRPDRCRPEVAASSACRSRLPCWKRRAHWVPPCSCWPCCWSG